MNHLFIYTVKLWKKFLLDIMAVYKEDSIFSTEALCHTQYFLLPSFDFIQLLLWRRKEHVHYQTRQDFMSPLVITAKAMWLAINFKNMVPARLACGTWYMMVQIYIPTVQKSKIQLYYCLKYSTRSTCVQTILYILHNYQYASVKKWFIIKLM